MIPDNPIVVVTGASRGIGRAIALRFADIPGSHIAISCRSSEKLLEDTGRIIRSKGCDCITYVGDMSVPGNVNEFFDIIRDRFGEADILVNNAGISYVGLLADMNDDEWDSVIGSNLNSVFYCCRSVIPGMVRKQSGCIINVSSVWGEAGASCEAAYSASKGGVNSLTRALAKELAPSGIQINAVACGLIDTSMNSHLSDEELKTLYDDIPVGRAGTPDEIADAIYGICAQTPYMTGQIIKIDGGWI